MEIKLDKRFTKQLKGTVEKYSFDVGILKDKAHRWPLSPRLHGLKTFAGGPARKTSPKNSYATLAGISDKFIKKEKYLTAPWKNKNNRDILNFMKAFFKVIFDNSKEKRLINMLQAIVRNPILRGDYGTNKAPAAKRKGFNRYMIDTGQFFKNIMARVVKG